MQSHAGHPGERFSARSPLCTRSQLNPCCVRLPLAQAEMKIDSEDVGYWKSNLSPGCSVVFEGYCLAGELAGTMPLASAAALAMPAGLAFCMPGCT